MAEDVTSRASRGERARRSSYRFRFGVVYLLLAAVFGAGVGSFIVLASRGKAPEPEAWSAWQPKGSGLAKVRQIADRIPKAYRAENGTQLTVSLGGPLSVPTPEGNVVPVRAVLVRPDTSKGLAEEDDVRVYQGSGTVSFSLCGTKSKEQCELTPASAERDALLRRQALELSLYTLKYVDDVDSVVVFLPPTKESQGTVFLRRTDVADELDRPLTSLFTTKRPRVGHLNSLEEGQIVRLTGSRTYGAEVQPSPDGSPVLILTPPAVATP
ncbi:MAG: hypothetical protein HOQ03_10880 [Thermoleophilia bacterium]|nr:hypothetical protein [Thermoleophilia bacterium]